MRDESQQQSIATAEDADVAAALEQYLRLLERGVAPSPDEFASQFPPVADRLRDCIESLLALEQNVTLLDEAAEPPGAVIPDFRILREVGRGGMGVVYEAQQLSLNRRVAVKVLPAAAGADERRVRRFQNEPLAAAQLDHPNIVAVYEVGRHAGSYFYVMQLVHGQSLRDLISDLRAETESESVDSRQRSRDHCSVIARLGIAAARGLGHAHAAGIVHRDIKPANLLLDDDGTLRVADFGLARLQAESDITASGDLPGTLRYMSPEQAAGSSAVPDHRTDIYSLGATLYELLTLQPLIPGANQAEILHAIANGRIAPLRQSSPHVPVDLETIVLKCIDCDRDNRYVSANDLADDLQRFLNDQPILARPLSPVQKVGRWVSRHRRTVVFSGLGLVLISGLLAAAIVVTAAALVDSRAATRASKDALAETRETLFTSWMHQAAVHRMSGRAGQQLTPVELLTRVIRQQNSADPVVDPVRLRSELAAAMGLCDVRPQSEWPAPDHFPGSTIAFSSGIRFCVLADPHSGDLRVIRTDNETEVGTMAGHGIPALLRLSPNGRFAAVASSERPSDFVFRVCDVRSSETVLKLPCGPFHGSADFSETGRQLACGFADGMLRLYDMETRKLIGGHPLLSVPFSIRVSPDERQVAVGISEAVLVVEPAAPSVRRLPFPGSIVTAVAWSPDGQFLAAGTTGRITVHNLRSNEVDCAIDVPVDILTDLHFSPDGEFLLAGCGQLNAGGLVHVASARVTLNLAASGMGFDSDGETIAWFADAKAGLTQLVRSPVCSEHGFPGKGQLYGYRMSVSSDGRLVARNGPDQVEISDRQFPAGVFDIDGAGTVTAAHFLTNDRLLVVGTDGVFVRRVVRSDHSPPHILPEDRVPQTTAMPHVLHGHTADRGMAAVSVDGHLRVIDLQTGDVRFSRAQGASLPTVAFHPDGRRIVVSDLFLGGIQVYGLDASEPQISIGADETTTCLCISADGALLAACQRGTLSLCETEGWLVVDTVQNADVAAFSPDNKLIAAARLGGEIRILHRATLRELFSVPGIDTSILGLIEFGPSGELIVTSITGHVSVWDIPELLSRLDTAGVGVGEL